MNKKNTSKIIKECGISSLKNLADYAEVTTQTIRNWRRDNPKLFYSVITKYLIDNVNKIENQNP